MLPSEEIHQVFHKVRSYLLKEGRNQLGIYGHNPKGGIAREFDRRVEDIVIEHFREKTWSMRILSEEREGPITIGEHPYDWTLVLDPVDGSDNYVHGYRQVAFAAAFIPGKLPVTLRNVSYAFVGNVYTNDIFTANKGGGTFLNNDMLPHFSLTKKIDTDSSLITINFDHGDRENTEAEERCWKLRNVAYSVRRSGSACIDICELARGSVVAYVDLRNALSPENFLAPFRIINETGCILVDGEGSDFIDNDLSDLSKVYTVVCARTEELARKIVNTG